MSKAFVSKLLVSVLIISSCSTARQGVKGRITQLQNNNRNQKFNETSTKGVSTNVLITIALAFNEIQKNDKGLYEIPAEKLIIKRIKTDENGNFKAYLSPGVYTILVETKDGWFAKEQDKNGVLNKITVEGKQMIERNIVMMN